MERKGTTGTVTVCELITGTGEELPVEMDFVLPDDCPDIVKILRCELRAGAMRAEPGADGVAVEGSVLADVWYIADTGLLHRVEGHTGFSRKCRCENMPEDAERARSRVTATEEYANARPVNQRRIEIKGAMELVPVVTSETRLGFLGACELPGVETRVASRTAVRPTARAFERFTVDEERPLPERLPTVGTVLRCEGAAAVTDRKAIDGKLATKGDLTVAVVYLPAGAGGENDAPVKAELTLPVSFLCEVAGLRSDADVGARYRVCRVEANARADESGEMRSLAIRAEMEVSAAAHENSTVTAVTDAYGLRNPVVTRPRTLALPELISCFERVLPVEIAGDAPAAGVTEVLDAWGMVRCGACRRREGGVTIPLHVELCAFIRDGNGRPAFFGRAEDIECEIASDAEEPFCRDAVASVSEVACKLTENGLAFTCKVMVTGCLYGRDRWEVLDDVEVDESVQLPTPPAPLSLYYADGGESVWEIARHFAAPAGAVREENGLDGDTVPERRLLLIER